MIIPAVTKSRTETSEYSNEDDQPKIDIRYTYRKRRNQFVIKETQEGLPVEDEEPVTLGMKQNFSGPWKDRTRIRPL